MLTGIRPAKTAAKLLEKGYDKKDVSELLSKYYMVNESKASLALNIAEKEIGLSQYKRDDFCSLYIGIPFCPSKCGYCSFVSCSTKGLFKLIPQYIEKLKTEILSAANIIKNHNLKLKTIYIGGGTPTILDEKLIEDLMGFIYKNLDFSNLLEYTYESGRPDTVTFEKLMTVKRYGAGRISVNTQTSNDEILAHIGRNHTFEDYKKAMDTARKVGFRSINTDLIAGLPGESVESFKKSVRDVMSFFPENITVHSFSVKKSSRYRHEENILNSEYAEKTRQMIDFSQETLLNSKYLPYYIYRQKNTAGNLENVGFCLCKTGYPSEGLYNIFMMEDMHTVLSCGAGSVTKLVRNGKVERIFNPKYPYEYLSFEDKIVSSAKAINSFYNNF